MSAFNNVDVVAVATTESWRTTTIGSTPVLLINCTFMRRAGSAALTALMAVTAISAQLRLPAEHPAVVAEAERLLGDGYTAGMASAFRALVAQ